MGFTGGTVNIFTVGLYYWTTHWFRRVQLTSIWFSVSFDITKRLYRSLVLKMKSFFTLPHSQCPDPLLILKGLVCSIIEIHEHPFNLTYLFWFCDVRRKAPSIYSRDCVTFLLTHIYDPLSWEQWPPVVFIWPCKCEKVAGLKLIMSTFGRSWVSLRKGLWGSRKELSFF